MDDEKNDLSPNSPECGARESTVLGSDFEGELESASTPDDLEFESYQSMEDDTIKVHSETVRKYEPST